MGELNNIFGSLNPDQRKIMGVAAISDAFGALRGQSGNQAMQYGALFNQANSSAKDAEYKAKQLEYVKAQINKLGVESNELLLNQQLTRQVAQMLGLSVPEVQQAAAADAGGVANGAQPAPGTGGANPMPLPGFALPNGQPQIPGAQPVAPGNPVPGVPQMGPQPTQQPGQFGLNVDQQTLLNASTLAALAGNSGLSTNLTNIHNSRKPDWQYVEMPDGSKKLINMNDPLGQRTQPGQPGQGGQPEGSVFPAALKPEQIATEKRDWFTRYYSPVNDVIGNFNTVVDLINSGQGGIADYGVLIKAIKALEPTSAVMQGEADSARAMMSIGDQMQSLLNRANKGGIGSDEARFQLAQLAQTAAKVAVEVYNNKAGQQRDFLGQMNISPELLNSMVPQVGMPVGANSPQDLADVLGMQLPSAIPAELRSKIPVGASTAKMGDRIIYALPGSQNWVYADTGEVVK